LEWRAIQKSLGKDLKKTIDLIKGDREKLADYFVKN